MGTRKYATSVVDRAEPAARRVAPGPSVRWAVPPLPARWVAAPVPAEGAGGIAWRRLGLAATGGPYHSSTAAGCGGDGQTGYRRV